MLIVDSHRMVFRTVRIFPVHCYGRNFAVLRDLRYGLPDFFPTLLQCGRHFVGVDTLDSYGICTTRRSRASDGGICSVVVRCEAECVRASISPDSLASVCRALALRYDGAVCSPIWFRKSNTEQKGCAYNEVAVKNIFEIRGYKLGASDAGVDFSLSKLFISSSHFSGFLLVAYGFPRFE